MSHVVSSHDHVMVESFGSHVFVSHGHVHVSHDHVQVANIVRHKQSDLDLSMDLGLGLGVFDWFSSTWTLEPYSWHLKSRLGLCETASSLL